MQNKYEWASKKYFMAGREIKVEGLNDHIPLPDELSGIAYQYNTDPRRIWLLEEVERTKERLLHIVNQQDTLRLNIYWTYLSSKLRGIEREYTSF